MKTVISIFGPTCLDHTIVVHDPISLDGSSRISHERKDLGGTGMCYALALSRLGVKTILYSKLGKDLEAKTIRKKAAEEKNLHPIWQTGPSETDYAYILLDNGNHKAVASKKTSNTSWKPHKRDIAEAMKSDAIVITSFPNKITREILIQVSKSSLPRPFIMWAPHLSNCREAGVVKDYIHLIDHISLSDEEFLELKKSIGSPLVLGVKTITITNGKKGCSLVSKSQVVTYPPYQALENPLDSNGAGEAFGSGFLITLLTSHDFPQSVQVGSYLAYLHIQRPASDFPKLSLVQLLKRAGPLVNNKPQQEIYE